MKGADFGKAIGIDRPANVKDKIKKWQQELNADAGADSASPPPKAPTTPKAKPVEEKDRVKKWQQELNAGACVESASPPPKAPVTPKAKPVEEKDRVKKWQQELNAGAGVESVTPPPFKLPTTPKAKPAEEKNRIKKWQHEINADTSVESTAVQPLKLPSTPKSKPVEEKASPKPTFIPTKPIHIETKSVDLPPEQPQGAIVHNVLDEDVQVVTAPKKRVVSDSHWRSNKALPKDVSKPALPKPASPKPAPNTPKDVSKPLSPKPVVNAWVRPAVRRVETPETKVAPPPPQLKSPLQPKPKVIAAAQRAGGRAGGRTRSQRKRRPSRPASAGNAERPTSSGLASPQGTKSADEEAASPVEKTELVRVRHRRSRTQTSPRGSSSLSADDLTNLGSVSLRKSETSLSADPANLITVEYEETSVVESSKQDATPKRDETRDKRRRSRRQDHSDVSQESSPKEPTSTRRRRSHRKSYQKDDEEAVRKTPEPVAPATPPQIPGNRLEAWLSTTPDRFVDPESRRRRTSKESVSTLDVAPITEKSDVSASNDSRERPVEVSERNSDSRRRRRRRSSPDNGEVMLDLDSIPPLAAPTELSDAPNSEKETELTPTPTLKRRGARRKSMHSPTKDRVMSLPARKLLEKDEDAVSSVPSSSVDSNAIELEKTPMRAPFEGPAMRRLFPSTGKRLSTIASIETFAKTQLATPSEAVGSETAETMVEQSDIVTALASDLGSQLETSTIVSRKSTRTRRRLASHADLISVLSMPKGGAGSIVSARSIRTNRSRLATATISDIMNELALDESKYMRELRTLVDGVIPVLLSCVLSKSDSAVAAGLFSPSASSDPSTLTKPIVDMGVSLERLKTLHKRVPKENPDAFLSWAQSAQRVYSDYINSWRLGFQDVVVSLASADEDPFTPAKVVNGPEDGAPWDEGLPRNAEGYVVNGDGERVDVAYMLKRPLVRLKYLSKSIKVGSHDHMKRALETFN
jgi:hypothetical protein